MYRLAHRSICDVRGRHRDNLLETLYNSLETGLDAVRQEVTEDVTKEVKNTTDQFIAEVDVIKERLDRIEHAPQPNQSESNPSGAYQETNRFPWVVNYWAPFPLTESERRLPLPPGPPQLPQAPIAQDTSKQPAGPNGTRDSGPQQSQQGSSSTVHDFKAQNANNKNSSSTALKVMTFSFILVPGELSIGPNPPLLVVPNHRPSTFKGYYNIGYNREVDGSQGIWEYFTCGDEASAEQHAQVNLRGQGKFDPEPEFVSARHVHVLRKHHQEKYGNDGATDGLDICWMPCSTPENLDKLRVRDDQDLQSGNENNNNTQVSGTSVSQQSQAANIGDVAQPGGEAEEAAQEEDFSTFPNSTEYEPDQLEITAVQPSQSNQQNAQRQDQVPGKSQEKVSNSAPPPSPASKSIGGSLAGHVATLRRRPIY